ncbi:pteridine reductase [Alteromonas sp. ASW11-130]|uniref:pteridine reductase n=1 Tax=Alteromonas sp. ASW11-130 TaxID=3015775 RepID=UPI0022426565|nr:pteridine reductase [Alteromonas sp. ASW11-130]MCW8090631.1 pteridine reductase [Alteromonas sp. ASW11-130]
MTDSPVALITGAAKRIGKTLAISLHDAGYRVIIHYHNSKEAAKALQGQLNTSKMNSAEIIQANLSDMEDVALLAKKALKAFGRIDVLVNNASAFYPTPLGKITLPVWDELIGSNVKGALFLVQALQKNLQQQNGCIINLTDMHIDRPLPEHSVYCLAKSALGSLTRSLATELAPTIRVNAIAPGPILWPERKMSKEEKEQLINTVPLKKLGSPEAIAHTMLFLINADYITGQTIYVDGGRSIQSNATA